MADSSTLAVGYGYGCERERLDPTDPQAEPGASDAWNAYLIEIAKAESELMAPTTKTPELPLALQPEMSISMELGPADLAISLSRTTTTNNNNTTTTEETIAETELTLAQVSESVRVHRLQGQAELQAIEDQFRKDWVASGFPLELLAGGGGTNGTTTTTTITTTGAKKSSLSTTMANDSVDDETLVQMLERIQLESDAWTNKKRKNNTAAAGVSTAKLDGTQGPDKEMLRKLVYLARKPFLPETVAENITSSYHDDFVRPYHHQGNSTTYENKYIPSESPEPILSDIPPEAVENVLAMKVREQEDYLEQVRAIEENIRRNERALQEGQLFLDRFDEIKARKARELEEAIQRRRKTVMEAAAKQKKEDAERAKREAERARWEAEEKKRREEAKAKQIADRLAREEQERRAAIRQEAERKLNEEKERQQRIRDEAQRKKDEAARKAKEAQDALDAQKAQAEQAAREKAQQFLLERERLKQEQEKREKEKQVQSPQVSSMPDEARLKEAVERLLSTMPYAASEYETVKAKYLQLIAWKQRYLRSVMRLGPPNPDHGRFFANYADFRVSMGIVELRVKTVKTYYMNGDLTTFKTRMSKKVMQVIGNSQGYMNTATDIVKQLQGVDHVQRGKEPQVLAVDDYRPPQQPKTGDKALPGMFLSLYNFVKIVLVKSMVEGPEKIAVLKALAMLMNSIMGGNATFWRHPALTMVLYYRFFEQSPSLFGAMGEKKDIGYRPLEGQIMESPTEVNGRAEVMATIFCLMGILRPSNTKREQIITIVDVHKVLMLNLRVPVHLRDELHYINIRTVMTIAPWTLRTYLGYENVVNLQSQIVRYCNEETNVKLKALASLLLEQIMALHGQGYTNAHREFGCDEWKYWDVKDIEETNTKRRAAGEVIHEQQVAVDIGVTQGRIDREKAVEEKFRPPGAETAPQRQ